jgi:hypothetical protein
MKKHIRKGEFSSESLIEQILEQWVEQERPTPPVTAQQDLPQARHAKRSAPDTDLALTIDDI